MKCILLLACLLSACATPEERFLSKAEDDAIREKCEPHGCVVVPTPLFEQIIKALKGQRGA